MRYLVFILVAGCVYGGGPYLGYGQHGWLGGVEAGGGVAVLQTTVGYQTHHDTVYVREDVVVDTIGYNAHGTSNGTSVGILGGGFRRSLDDYDTGGVFTVGARWVRPVELYCDNFATAELVTLELRYVREWQLVLAPRIERRGVPCFGG
jgi:hypothetical protein